MQCNEKQGNVMWCCKRRCNAMKHDEKSEHSCSVGPSDHKQVQCNGSVHCNANVKCKTKQYNVMICNVTQGKGGWPKWPQTRGRWPQVMSTDPHWQDSAQVLMKYSFLTGRTESNSVKYWWSTAILTGVKYRSWRPLMYSLVRVISTDPLTSA